MLKKMSIGVFVIVSAFCPLIYAGDGEDIIVTGERGYMSPLDWYEEYVRQEQLRQHAQRAAEAERQRALAEQSRRNQLKAKCVGDAKGLGGWCRHNAHKMNVNDTSACGSMASGFSGNFELSFRVITIGAGWSADAKVAHCHAVVAAELGRALAECDFNEQRNLNFCG